MRQSLQIIAAITGGIFTLCITSYLGLHWAGFLGKESEKLRTGILKESQAWTDGKRNELNRLYLEYQKADNAGRIGISNVVRDAFAAEDIGAYPAHLQTFLTQVGAR